MPFQNSFWALELSNWKLLYRLISTFVLYLKKSCLTNWLDIEIFLSACVWRRCLIGTHLTTTEYHSGQKGKQASEFLFCFQTVDYKNSGGVVTMIPYYSSRVKMLPLKMLQVITQIQYFYFKISNVAPQINKSPVLIRILVWPISSLTKNIS